MLLKGSRYADRLPIGTPEIIQNANPARLKQFYADWYRPDLMAVVVVGDVDKAAVETMIKSHFASIPTRALREAASGVQRARSTGHRIREHHRPGSDDHPHRCVRAHGGSAVRHH
jgi:predicted Zn-dependent peptidase